MSEMYQIIPVDINRQYSYFKVFIQNVALFTGANISVELYDQNRTIIESKYICLTQQEYTGWSEDDNYIINLIASKFGYTLYSPLPPTVVDPEPTVVDPEPTVVDPEPTVVDSSPTV